MPVPVMQGLLVPGAQRQELSIEAENSQTKPELDEPTGGTQKPAKQLVSFPDAPRAARQILGLQPPGPPPG